MMTLTRLQKKEAKNALLDYAWNLYEFPETYPDLSDEQRVYIKGLIFRMAKSFGVQEF